MAYRVELTEDALADIDNIAQFYIEAGEPLFASQIIEQLHTAVATLAHQPIRGYTPHELYGIGATDEREIIIEKYRIIYLLRRKTVFVIVVFHGRQNVSSYLSQRYQQLDRNE